MILNNNDKGILKFYIMEIIGIVLNFGNVLNGLKVLVFSF